MMELRYYLALPWSIRRSERNDDGNYTVLTVKELPGFVVAGTIDEVEAEFWPAMEEFLRSYVEAGEEPPVPSIVRERDAQVRQELAAAQAQHPPAPAVSGSPFLQTTRIAHGEPQLA